MPNEVIYLKPKISLENGNSPHPLPTSIWQHGCCHSRLPSRKPLQYRTESLRNIRGQHYEDSTIESHARVKNLKLKVGVYSMKHSSKEKFMSETYEDLSKV